MPDDAVRARSPEPKLRVGDSTQVKPDLAQPEQIEVVDEKGGDQDGEPPRGIQNIEKQPPGVVFDVPDHASHGLPSPEQHEQGHAGEQYIGAAFDGRRYEPRPNKLEPLARHDAMLECENSQQGCVDGQGIDEGPVGSGVNGLRHTEISYKAHAVQECGKEHQIADDTIQKNRNSFEHYFPGLLP